MVGKQQVSDARARVLAAVHEALEDIRGQAHVQPPVTIFRETSENKSDLAGQFKVELEAVAGTAIIVRDRAECAAALASYLIARDVRSVAVQASSLAQEIASALDGFDVASAMERSKSELERCDCALLEARSLLADTGSAVVILDNGHDRALPYLPRTCAIVAGIESLHSTLTPEALACIADAASAGTRGEALIVAGPSRTADIEKTLVLGAHGPASVAVFIIEQP